MVQFNKLILIRETSRLLCSEWIQSTGIRNRNNRMEASEQKLLADYLLKTGRIKTLEVLRSEWIPEKRTKLSFSIETAPRRKQIEINKPRASTSKSLKNSKANQKRMIFTCYSLEENRNIYNKEYSG